MQRRRASRSLRRWNGPCVSKSWLPLPPERYAPCRRPTSASMAFVNRRVQSQHPTHGELGRRWTAEPKLGEASIRVGAVSNTPVPPSACQEADTCLVPCSSATALDRDRRTDRYGSGPQGDRRQRTRGVSPRGTYTGAVETVWILDRHTGVSADPPLLDPATSEQPAQRAMVSTEAHGRDFPSWRVWHAAQRRACGSSKSRANGISTWQSMQRP